MRFYSEIRIEPRKHLYEICNNPCLVFSTDFINYLMALHDVAWCPIESRPGPYQSHPMSPCTKNVRKAMQQILAKSELNYKLLYDKFVLTKAENKLELFIERAKIILGSVTDDPLDAFFAFLHFGRWTVMFYTNGTKDSAYLASYLMADALKKVLENSFIAVWFRKLDDIAQYLVAILRKGFAERFEEETYRFDEEFDDFEECAICGCGNCKHPYENCPGWYKGSNEYLPDIYSEDDYYLSDEYESCNMELEEFSEDQVFRDKGSDEYLPDIYSEDDDYYLYEKYENSDMELEEFLEDTECEENQGAV